MKRKIVIVTVSVLCLITFCFIPVSAASETVIDDEGWVVYKRIANMSYTYAVSDPDSSASYITRNVTDIPLPYGPRSVTFFDNPVSGFWVNNALFDYDTETLTSTIATIQPGEALVVSWSYKLWINYYASAESYQPLDIDQYECRIYLDDDYTKYLSPSLALSSTSGAQLYYQINNNTDSPIELSRVSCGIFDDSGSTLEGYGFQYYLGSLKYRIVSSGQLATEAIKDAIEGQTVEIIGGIEDATDQIIGGWDPDPTPPDGSEIVDDYTDLDSQIQDFTTDPLSQALGLFNTLDIQFTGLVSCFTFMIKIFDQFEGTWISLLCIVSLTFGFIGFSINLIGKAWRGD